jgi:hypothetical protein
MYIYYRKQISGLFKVFTEADLSFIEYNYEITATDSDNDNIIGQELSLDDISALTTANGSYLVFQLSNAYNDWQMLSATDVIADFQTNVQNALAHASMKELKFVNCPVHIDYQPTPSTPAQSTDSDMDYDNPSTQYLLVTPAQIKAMIDQAIAESGGGGGGRGIPVVPVTVDP